MTDGSKAAANRRARDERKAAHLRAIFDRYAGEFRAAAARDALSVAREAHIAVDELLDRDRKKDSTSAHIKCRKGCVHCCHEAVEIWPQEAALLASTAHERGIELDRARLERQCRHTIESWQRQPRADTACVFLGEDGACKVYESRPNACRKLLVVTDPALCDAQQHPADVVGRWFSWEAEILESAALDVFGASLMPRLLLAALDRSK